MLKILKDFKLPIILGSIAIVAVVATILILFNGKAETGLYISDVKGAVSVLSSNGNTDSVSNGTLLKEGDIITVGDNASCNVTYKGTKNSENNYVIIHRDSQVVVNSEFDGKNNGQILLNKGSVLCNLKEKDKAQIEVRTADALVYTANTVSRVAYSTEEFVSFTDVHSFMGNAKIQMYNSYGEKVNDAELLVAKLAGRVTTDEATGGPVFAFLNVEFPLSDMPSYDLKSLLTIATLVTDFPYSIQEIKEAYDNSDDSSKDPNDELDIPDVTPDDSSDIIQTADPVVTTPPETTTNPDVHVITQDPTTTTRAPATTTNTPSTTTQNSEATTKSSSSNNSLYYVTVIINGDETIQEVMHGEDAEVPEVPKIDGMRFVRWDGSFKNITSDVVINAIFESDGTSTTHIVTIVIGDRSTTMTVPHGEAANIPATVNIEGYTFIGWDNTDYFNVTSDITVTALLQPNEYIVTFVIDGLYFPTTVKHGQSAVAPFVPNVDANGNKFVKWDRDLTNITSNMMVNAIYSSSVEYTVTFVIDGYAYPVVVKSGEAAIPPYIPMMNSEGELFVYWDKTFSNVTSDMVVTAIFN